MQVYRGLDIGTDKVAQSVRATVPHRLIDVFDLHETFSAGDFVHLARLALTDIIARGKTPIITGGTGFYLQMLMRGPPGTPQANDEIKAQVRGYLSCPIDTKVPNIACVPQIEQDLANLPWESALARLAALDPVYARSLFR